MTDAEKYTCGNSLSTWPSTSAIVFSHLSKNYEKTNRDPTGVERLKTREQIRTET